MSVELVEGVAAGVLRRHLRCTGNSWDRFIVIGDDPINHGVIPYVPKRYIVEIFADLAERQVHHVTNAYSMHTQEGYIDPILLLPHIPDFSF